MKMALNIYNIHFRNKLSPKDLDSMYLYGVMKTCALPFRAMGSMAQSPEQALSSKKIIQAVAFDLI